MDHDSCSSGGLWSEFPHAGSGSSASWLTCEPRPHLHSLYSRRRLLSFLCNSLTCGGGITREYACVHAHTHTRTRQTLQKRNLGKQRCSNSLCHGLRELQQRSLSQRDRGTMSRTLPWLAWWSCLLLQATFHSTLQLAQLITPQSEYQNLTWLNADTLPSPRLPPRR